MYIIELDDFILIFDTFNIELTCPLLIGFGIVIDGKVRTNGEGREGRFFEL